MESKQVALWREEGSRAKMGGYYTTPAPARRAAMDLHLLPPLWQDLVRAMAFFLHQRNAGRLAVLLLGALFAQGRRTVTSWLRSAGVGAGHAAYYYFLAALGRKAGPLAGVLLQ